MFMLRMGSKKKRSTTRIRLMKTPLKRVVLNKDSLFCLDDTREPNLRNELCKPPPEKGIKKAKVDNVYAKTPYSWGERILIKSKEVKKLHNLVTSDPDRT